MDTDVPVPCLIATILCAAAFGWVAVYELPMMMHRTFLEHAAVCSRLLRNTSNLDDRRKLEGLRKRWKRLALDMWRLEAAEAAEQVKACDAQARVLAEIRQTVH